MQGNPTPGAICTDPKPFRYYRRIRRLAPGTWTADNKPAPPRGWRWLNVGERTGYEDLCCDPRAWPVVILYGGWMMTDKSHPVLRKLCNDRRAADAYPPEIRDTRWLAGFYAGVCSALACLGAHEDGTSVIYVETVRACGARELLTYAERENDMEVPNIRLAVKEIRRRQRVRYLGAHP